MERSSSRRSGAMKRDCRCLLAPWRALEAELLMVDVGERGCGIPSSLESKLLEMDSGRRGGGISRRISCRRTRASHVPPFEADANGQARRWPSDAFASLPPWCPQCR
jgi:hypothetical protein